MAEKNYLRLGDYVVSRRKERGLDRETLAKEAGITVRTLGDVESGKLGDRKDFSQDTMEAIGLVLAWRPGSWREILEGGEPQLVDEDFADELVDQEGFEQHRGTSLAPSIATLDAVRILRTIEDIENRLAQVELHLPTSIGIMDDAGEVPSIRPAARTGTSKGQQTRKQLDSIGEENQDPEGGH